MEITFNAFRRPKISLKKLLFVCFVFIVVVFIVGIFVIIYGFCFSPSQIKIRYTLYLSFGTYHEKKSPDHVKDEPLD